MMPRFRLILLATLVLSAPSVSLAQNFWENMSGPPPIGIEALASGENGLILAGTYDGILRSTDSGQSWEWAKSGQSDTIEIGPFAFGDHGNIFAAVGLIPWGKGLILWSGDKGATWQTTNSELDSSFISISSWNGILYAS